MIFFALSYTCYLSIVCSKGITVFLCSSQEDIEKFRQEMTQKQQQLKQEGDAAAAASEEAEAAAPQTDAPQPAAPELDWRQKNVTM